MSKTTTTTTTQPVVNVPALQPEIGQPAPGQPPQESTITVPAKVTTTVEKTEE